MEPGHNMSTNTPSIPASENSGLLNSSATPNTNDPVVAALPSTTSETEEMSMPETPKITFKLGDLLPQNIMPSVLNNDVKLFKHISQYLDSLPSTEHTTCISELDLNLPSSYASILTKQYSSFVLVEIVERVLDAFPFSDVLQFPAIMQLENLNTSVKRLCTKFEKKNVEYKEIHLSFSVSETSTTSNPMTVASNIYESFSTFIKVKKELDLALKDVLYRIEIKDDTKSKKQNEVKQKAGKKTTKKLPVLSSQSKIFTYDFQLMSPYVVGTQMFTAYSYWNMEIIHKQYKFTGKGVNVAILDTGVSVFHEAFAGKDLINEIFSSDMIDNDTHGHGTLCAGILCGKAFKWHINDKEVLECPDGIAPDANLRVYKVSDNQGSANNLAIVNALKDILNNHPEIDVISISFGSMGINLDMIKVINDLVTKGVIVVCCASNNGHQYSQPICYPARMGNVLCIGSHDSHGKASAFSPVGQQIDFLAPGENISGPNNTLYYSSICTDSGTSYATPAVAGLVCLIIEFIIANAKPDEIKRYKNHWVMKEILRKISTCPGRHIYDEGFGALNPINFFRRPHELIQSVNDELPI